MTQFGDGALIACDRLVRIYQAEGIEVQALQGLDLTVGKGELTALVGQLQGQLSAGDLAAAGETAHRIAGLADHFGLVELATLAETLDLAIRDGRLTPEAAAGEGARLALSLSGLDWGVLEPARTGP